MIEYMIWNGNHNLAIIYLFSMFVIHFGVKSHIDLKMAIRKRNAEIEDKESVDLAFPKSNVTQWNTDLAVIQTRSMIRRGFSIRRAMDYTIYFWNQTKTPLD
jgi:hypothetical protein